MSQLILRFAFSLAVVLVSSLSWALAADDQPIDVQKAKQLFQRRQMGETLSEEDQAYLRRAMEFVRQRQQQGGRPGQPGGSNRPGLPSAPPATKSTGLTPLTDLKTGDYKGQTGGLYGGGQNEPPAEHRAAVEKQLRLIEPLDAEGKPAADGKIALLSIGMSNTTMEYQAFKQQADADPRKSPNVVIVYGAQGGVVASRWAGTQPMPGPNSGAADQSRPGRADPWAVLDKRVTEAGVTSQQVQACWMKQAQSGPAQQGEFPKHAEILADNIILTLGKLHERFPNLRVVYLSSRIYAGYALTGLNPEPYAYEGAFANRWVIERQFEGDAKLNFDPAKGTVTAPAVVWGPYLWADGIKPRSDGLVWLEDDLVPNDRTHPSQSGREKVAKLLLDFMHDNPLASCWYLGSQSTGK